MKAFAFLILIALVAGCISQAAEKPVIVNKLNITPAEEKTLAERRYIGENQTLSANKTQQINGTARASGTTTPQSAPAVKEFYITAKRFEFSPAEITVNKGDTVRLKITSSDVNHGFALGAYGINQMIEANKTTVIEFNATEQGTFPFMCNIYCGAGHPGMKGLLIVQ
jgi:cytochrome c oxidase subunit II